LYAISEPYDPKVTWDEARMDTYKFLTRSSPVSAAFNNRMYLALALNHPIKDNHIIFYYSHEYLPGGETPVTLELPISKLEVIIYMIKQDSMGHTLMKEINHVMLCVTSSKKVLIYLLNEVNDQ
jgi:hypothetical protein